MIFQALHVEGETMEEALRVNTRILQKLIPDLPAEERTSCMQNLKHQKGERKNHQLHKLTALASLH